MSSSLRNAYNLVTSQEAEAAEPNIAFNEKNLTEAEKEGIKL